MTQNIPIISKLFVKQTFELAEIFGFESRNKYRIFDEGGQDLAFAAEQQKGFLSFIARQFLGHWRTFELHFFNTQRQEFMIANHPFRWFFQRLELREINGRFIGAIQRRFSILTKRFDVQDIQGNTLMEISSPIWRIWTFPFIKQGREVARISKKWSGIGSEIFTDRDNFMVDYFDAKLTNDERALVLASAIYVDLMFFERRGSGGGLNMLGG